MSLITRNKLERRAACRRVQEKESLKKKLEALSRRSK
jgi:hypothetical protein